MDIIKKLNYIFTKKQKLWLCILTIIILIGATLELVGVAAIMPLVDVITTPAVIHNKNSYRYVYDYLNMSSDKQFVLLLIGFLICVYILKNIYIIFMNDIQNRFSYNNQRVIAMRLMDCYMKQTYVYHLTKNVSELQRNIQGDIVMLFGGVLAAIQLVSELVTCVFIGTYLIILDKTISVGVIILLGVFAGIFLKVTKKKALFYGEEVRDYNWKLNKWVRQSFEGIKEIKVANREDMYIKQVDAVFAGQAVVGRKRNVINAMPRPIFEAICISSMLFVVGIKILRGVDLGYFIPVLSAFAVAAFRLLPSFGRVTAYINDVIYYSSSIDSVYKDLKEVDELQAKYVTRYTDKSKMVFLNSLKIDNITFSYPNVEKPVLENVSFEIKKDTSVALIGPSGAGKTTMADIILGLLEPQEGNVYVDNVDIYERPYGWHQLLGYIPQTIYLTDDTIRDNILFGIPETESSDEMVWEALERAQLAEFVRGLKDGLDTIVGERGVRLSGGQRQRIGIARALYSNPQILVLDEATSALDNETETAVMEAIDSLRGSRTMIIIAHRITTIRNCDVIFEVKDRKIYPINKDDVLKDVIKSDKE